jgi:cyclopropane fatty-acyl-phospholipid synthase-like methyltransferase
VLDRLELAPSDTFVDLGCGKGRVVCCAARRNIRMAIGVDLDRELCEQADANSKRMNHRNAPITILNLPAQEADYRECTVVFMFNPFGPGTLTSVLQRIKASLISNPRKVKIAYVNPRLDHCIADSGAFTRYDHWRCRPWGRLKFDVSFWQSIVS